MNNRLLPDFNSPDVLIFKVACLASRVTGFKKSTFSTSKTELLSNCNNSFEKEVLPEVQKVLPLLTRKDPLLDTTAPATFTRVPEDKVIVPLSWAREPLMFVS